MKWIFRASFALTCFFLAGMTYLANIKELGGKDTVFMAPIAPFIVVALYVVLMMAVTENMGDRGKVIMGLISLTITGLGLYSLWAA